MSLLQITNQPSSDVVQLLQHNKIGTPIHSLVYQHGRVQEKLAVLGNPFFIELRIHDQLVGTCCFIRRQVLIARRERVVYYIRYFTFQESRRSSRPRPLNKRQGLLYEEIAQLLEGQNLPDKQPVLYAYIDPENVRSFQLAQKFGFQSHGEFRSIYFSRLFPKAHPAVIPLEKEGLEQAKVLFLKTYGHSDYYQDPLSTSIGEWFGYWDSGQIIAAVRVIPEYWKIHQLKGRFGQKLIASLSVMPLLNRLIKRDFYFLGIDLVVDQAEPRQIENLLSAVLSRYERHTAVFCVDPQHPVYDLLTTMDLGLLSMLVPQKRMEMMVRGIEPDSGPIYVSPFDVM